MSASMQARDASEALKALEREYAILQRDRDSLRAIVDTYVSDEPSTHEETLRKRVAQLETAVTEKTALVNELLKKVQQRPADVAGVHAELDAAKSELEQLKAENARLMEELGKAETKLLRGEFDPKTTKVQ